MMMLLAGADGCAQCFPFVIIGSFLLAIPLLVYYGVQTAKRQWAEAAEVAKRYGGVLNEGGWLSQSSIALRIQDSPARLTAHAGSKNNPAYTRIELQLSLPFRLRLGPQDIFLGVRKFFGAQDIEIGNAEFDAAFQIEADSDATARRVLTRDIRSILLALRANGVGLEIRPGAMMIRLGRYLVSRPDELRVFLAQVDDLILALRELNGMAGVTIVEAKAQDGNCLTCGTPLGHDYVTCLKCKTPQHRDCWDYVGSCAVYACGGRKHIAWNIKSA